MKIDDYPSRLTGSSYYYVRTAWEDDSTQIGQYRTLKGTIARADANPGSYVFTGDGIAIYPEDEETVTMSEETEETDQDGQKPVLDEPEREGTDGSKEVAAAGEEAAVSGPGASEEAVSESTAEENTEAQTEAEDGLPNDGNTETILYGKTTTLVNIRDGCSLDADRVTVMRKGLLVEILEECGNGWYRIRCEAAECGYAYVSGEYLTVCGSVYTVQPADTLWKIAEKLLGSGTKYTDIKKANGLTSNVLRVGMVLLIP